MGPVIESVGGREDKGRDEITSPGHDSTVDTGHGHLWQAGRRHSFLLRMRSRILQNDECHRISSDILSFNKSVLALNLKISWCFMILKNRPIIVQQPNKPACCKGLGGREVEGRAEQRMTLDTSVPLQYPSRPVSTPNPPNRSHYPAQVQEK